jgi:hypothetical protein
MPPLSSVLRNCFYSVFELTWVWGGMGRVCVPILCVIQVVKLKTKYKFNQSVRLYAKHIASEIGDFQWRANATSSLYFRSFDFFVKKVKVSL